MDSCCFCLTFGSFSFPYAAVFAWQAFLASSVFGRDEDDDSGMELRQQDVDESVHIILLHADGRMPMPLISQWSTVVLDMSVSDRNKSLLLASPDLMTLVRLALFIDPDHARADTPVEIQQVYQRNYSEALQQLALFPPGREAILQEPSIVKALQEVAERGVTPEAREHAEVALLALSDKEMQASGSEGPKHIMLSYQVRGDEASCLFLFRLLTLCALAAATVGLAADDPAHPQLALQTILPRMDRHRDDEGQHDGRACCFRV